MAYQITQNDLDILDQSSHEIYLYVELLNKDMKIIDEIQGVIINASFSIDADSDIRRTCTFSIHVLDSTFYLTENSRVWLDKFFRVYIGYRHIRSGQILKYNLGIYLPDVYSYSYSYEENILSLDGVDMMAKLMGDYGSVIPEQSIIVKAGENIRQVMIDTITQLGGIKTYLIGDIGAEITPTDEVPDPRILPYDIELGIDSSVYDLLVELRDVWVGWEFFFDVNGTFICQLIPNGENDPISVTDTIWQKICISESTEINRTDIKNHIVVYGETKDDGTQIKGEAKDENPESPFSINKIGDIIAVKSDGDFAKIFSNDYANQRADYELYLAARINDTISIQTVLLPWLDVNLKVTYTSQETGETHDYLTKSISFDAGNGVMDISMMRFYPQYPQIIHYE